MQHRSSHTLSSFSWSDPRHFQIAVLSLLLLYGVGWLSFDISLLQILTLLITTLTSQYILTRKFHLPYYDPRSPLISGLSLCLLLRSNSLLLMIATAFLTIASKFILKRQQKHIFNPTNFGLVTMMIFTNQIWVSPGQWGSKAFFGFLLACLGGLVINRAARSDVTYAFLLFYSTVLFGRALWLGDPITIPWHQFQSGAFLIFAFFMISDPKTTPNSRAGRVLFALLVAAGAATVQFGLFRTNAMLWSLAAFSPLVPIIDHWLPGGRFEWACLNSNNAEKGVNYETRRVVTSHLFHPMG